MLWKISAALARMKEKKIEGNTVGDYSRKGGVLIVARGGGFHGFTMEVGLSPTILREIPFCQGFCSSFKVRLCAMCSVLCAVSCGL